jgi:hypothetical protein
MHSLYPILLCCVVHYQMFEDECFCTRNFLESAFGPT